MQTEHMIEAYTDGACEPNPGPGSWAAVILDRRGKVPWVRELGKFVGMTTNNRMELQSGLEVLRYDKTVSVKIFSDANYLTDGATKWILGWKRRKPAWKRVMNTDLWHEIDDLLAGRRVSFEQVPGHSGVPGNERADEICTALIFGLPLDLYDGPLDGYPLPVFRVTTPIRGQK